MGAEETLTSRALPRLLVFVLAACGGRYSGQNGSEGSAGTAGKSGATSNAPDDEPGGVDMPAQGGRSSGSGGASFGGKTVGMGGTGFGIAGAVTGTAGMATGSGGSNPGRPTDPMVICHDYCSAHTALCPEVDTAVCSKQCFGQLLNASNACLVTMQEQYACIAQAFAQAASCTDAHYLASKLCGSDGSMPIPCDEVCNVSIFGDASGCHAVSSCATGVADLHCIESGGPPLCSCWVNGTKVADLLTSGDSAKAACIDDELRQLCMSQLP